MKKCTLLIMIFSLVFCSNAFAKKKKSSPPQWLENPKSVYNEQMYLSAIGEGDSRTQAENMAAGNLARIFESRVKTDETYRQRYQELTKDGSTSYEDRSEVVKNVNIQAEQTLVNVEFGESYTNNLGRVFTIAYLNRMKTGQIYEEKINSNTKIIRHYLTMAESAGDPLFKYAAFSAAAAVSMNNEILIDQLSIIFPASKEMLELDYNHADLIKKTADISKQISFYVNIENDEANKIKILIEELMNDLGFVLSQEYLLYADGQVIFEETDLNREEKFIRYEVQLQISDLYDNILVTLNEKGREGHISYSEAKARAVRAIEKKIKNELKMKLISYFDRLIIAK